MADLVRVFVSHHHSPDEDAFTARLVADLEAAGADVWVDNKGITSDDFVQKISEGLEGRQWLVLVMTPQAVASKWVRREVNTALHEHTDGRMLGVVPIVVMPTPEQDIPLLWRPLHRYDATRAYEPARDGLLRALGLFLSTAPAKRKSAVRFGGISRGLDALIPGFDPYSDRMPDVPARLASLGFHGINANSTPAILPPLVSVAAGSFLMGSDKAYDKEAYDGELPQHRVELESFQIGTYPVTVAEYALAVRDGAVREPPEAWGVLWQTQRQRPDHPVVCVSWQDATAYVSWLRKVTGQPDWRLPSEAEWEKAARWDAQRGVSQIYPWGDTFDKNRCNTSESSIGSTTPVGSYPASDALHSGASPCGAEEMAGNVWEWTSSLFTPYPYAVNDGREDLLSTESRTLRGGSWFNGAEYARAACHVADRPGVSGDVFGFRLLLRVPPPPRLPGSFY